LTRRSYTFGQVGKGFGKKNFFWDANLLVLTNLQTNETYEDIFQNRFPDKLLSLGSGFRKPILGGWREINGADNMVDTSVSEDS
jgi:hypothetical protein